MSIPNTELPDPALWPLQIFLFARWNRDPAPHPSTVASSKDLKYYLRAMRGPHWKFTIPLCVDGATDGDVEVLETALAYMETRPCELWLYPMDRWTTTRVFVIAVHAWASRDPRLHRCNWEGLRDLIPHVTPYLRDGPIYDMVPTITGLAELCKKFLPMEIFHYRKMFYREHTIAVSKLHKIPVWRDVGIQVDNTSDEGPSTEQKDNKMEENEGSVLVDVYDTDVHSAEDPREITSICITSGSLPALRSQDMLQKIPLPTMISS